MEDPKWTENEKEVMVRTFTANELCLTPNFPNRLSFCLNKAFFPPLVAFWAIIPQQPFGTQGSSDPATQIYDRLRCV
jgi:hypothetical protein